MTESKPELQRVYDETIQNMPLKWHQPKTFLGAYAQAVCVIFVTNLTYEYLTEDRPIYSRIIPLIVYTLGMIADNYSTIRIMRTNEELQKHDVESGIAEGNPLIGPVKTQKEFLQNPRHWIVEAVGYSAAALIPGAGVGFGAGRAYIATLNMKNAHRVELALDVVKERKLDIIAHQVSLSSRG